MSIVSRDLAWLWIIHSFSPPPGNIFISFFNGSKIKHGSFYILIVAFLKLIKKEAFKSNLLPLLRYILCEKKNPLHPSYSREVTV